MKIQFSGFFQRLFPLMAISMLLLSTPLRAEVVLVVNAKNPLLNLTKEQAADIFMGRASQFPNGEEAIPLDLPDGELKAQFYLKISEKTPQQMRAYWLKVVYAGKGHPPPKANTATELKKLIATNQSFIGYLEATDADASVKIVEIR